MYKDSMFLGYFMKKYLLQQNTMLLSITFEENYDNVIMYSAQYE